MLTWLFVNTTYYLLMAAVLCWVGTYLHHARGMRRDTAVAWARENWPGLAVAAAVTLAAGIAVEPALRVLSDETNLIGTSKNLFASKTATFTVSGKNYYGSFWDVDVAIDRRPTLFPFLVSLIHATFGYSYENAFHLNLLVLPAFVLLAYRLAKSLGGETFGVVSALFVAAHPITLLAARSGGFDFLATFFGLFVIKSLVDQLREPSPGRLAVLWMNLCLFAEVRYETALFVPLVVVLLLRFRAVTRTLLRPYAFVYALSPVFLLPRVLQAILRGNVPEQDPGTVTFSVENFLNNAQEYFAPLLEPTKSHPFHSALLIALGVAGCATWLWRFTRLPRNERPVLEARVAACVAAWMLLQVVIVFTYVWGRAQYPSAARLVIPIDTFFSFAAAGALTRALARFRAFVPVLLAGAVLVAEFPGPPQYRALNKLTQTRESATTWRFFERLGEKRILIVTDRPNHFTIMDYGAMNFETAKRDPYLFTALARRLFHDVYVIQQIALSTKEPLPGYAIWPDRKLETVHEFQNDANVLVRVSRLAR
ncbi:MAG TPA: glycosyltransferase family 39 protein [Polyangiaceae bacterium]